MQVVNIIKLNRTQHSINVVADSRPAQHAYHCNQITFFTAVGDLNSVLGVKLCSQV